MHRLLTFFCFVFALQSLGARAQDDAVKALVGGWEMSNADRDRTCTINFKSDPVRGGYRLELDAACATNFPFSKDIQLWNVHDDILRLLDARGRVVVEFQEVESGMYEAERPGEGLVFLQNSAVAGPPLPIADKIAGDWAIMRGNKTICTLILASNEQGDGYALRLNSGCDPLVTRFNPAFWRLDEEDIVLVSASGESWRFEEDEENSWRRIGESGDPMLLVRR
jgi:hypothetical protein